MHFFWRGSCSAQVLSWCLHGLWGQRLLLRSALQVRCARSPEGRAPRTPRREGQSRVGSTDPSVFLWAQENSLNVPIAPCPYYCRLDKPMRLSRNGLGDGEGGHARGKSRCHQLSVVISDLAGRSCLAELSRSNARATLPAGFWRACLPRTVSIQCRD